MAYLLDEQKIAFPHPSLADEDGLLAIGGDLQPARLILAYQHGIFPWYDEDSPILWYAPLMRFVIPCENIHVSKSLKQVIKSKKFRVTANQDFQVVIKNCAEISRKDQAGTWIIQEMIEAYIRLHELGIAHSIEVWENDELVGGLYGVLIGRVFCGESMFSKVSNASKIALVHLATSYDIQLIDCQFPTEHLLSMGASSMPQKEFLSILAKQETTAYGLQ
ncbi:leucyl/phenylalanyl-tRNA--protein transferase [Sphingobacterium kyonggiense]|uniref:Leucyl/phenylalanyl-tRNA--protein transferase n=1 Tax=Sphingobacterium kyonggiense TaxID=714075 RepID=A0ABP7YYB5_9SPHI